MKALQSSYLNPTVLALQLQVDFIGAPSTRETQKVMMRIEGLQYVFLEKYPTSNQPNPAKQLDITASSL